jgi:hypothetical protein
MSHERVYEHEDGRDGVSRPALSGGLEIITEVRRDSAEVDRQSAPQIILNITFSHTCTRAGRRNCPERGWGTKRIFSKRCSAVVRARDGAAGAPNLRGARSQVTDAQSAEKRTRHSCH